MENQKDFNKVFGKLASDLFKANLIAIVMHIANDFDLDSQAVLESVKKIDVKKIAPARRTKRAPVPGAPNRAKTAYIFFSTAVRPGLKADDGSALLFAEAGRKIGRLWGELNVEDKSVYVKMAEDDRERYEREMLKFNPNFKPKGNSKKEEKTELEKHQGGIQTAKDKSIGDAVHCYNVSTSRTIKYQSDKPGDKVWMADSNVCANSQEDLDHWVVELKLQKGTSTKASSKKTEESDFSDSEETAPPPPQPKKKAPATKKSKK